MSSLSRNLYNYLIEHPIIVDDKPELLFTSVTKDDLDNFLNATPKEWSGTYFSRIFLRQVPNTKKLYITVPLGYINNEWIAVLNVDKLMVSELDAGCYDLLPEGMKLGYDKGKYTFDQNIKEKKFVPVELQDIGNLTDSRLAYCDSDATYTKKLPKLSETTTDLPSEPVQNGAISIVHFTHLYYQNILDIPEILEKYDNQLLFWIHYPQSNRSELGHFLNDELLDSELNPESDYLYFYNHSFREKIGDELYSKVIHGVIIDENPELNALEDVDIPENINVYDTTGKILLGQVSLNMNSDTVVGKRSYLYTPLHKPNSTQTTYISLDNIVYSYKKPEKHTERPLELPIGNIPTDNEKCRWSGNRKWTNLGFKNPHSVLIFILALGAPNFYELLVEKQHETPTPPLVKAICRNIEYLYTGKTDTYKIFKVRPKSEIDESNINWLHKWTTMMGILNLTDFLNLKSKNMYCKLIATDDTLQWEKLDHLESKSQIEKIINETALGNKSTDRVLTLETFENNEILSLGKLIYQNIIFGSLTNDTLINAKFVGVVSDIYSDGILALNISRNNVNVGVNLENIISIMGRTYRLVGAISNTNFISRCGYRYYKISKVGTISQISLDRWNALEHKKVQFVIYTRIDDNTIESNLENELNVQEECDVLNMNYLESVDENLKINTLLNDKQNIKNLKDILAHIYR